MKIPKKKNRLKMILIPSAVVFALLLALGVYLVVFKGSLMGWSPFGSEDTVTKDPPTQSSSDTSHGTKDDLDLGPIQTTDEVPVNSSLSATIDELSQSNGFIVFNGSVNDNQAGGSCTVTFSNENDRPVTQTVAANVANKRATCDEIKIPETSFSFLGEWIVTFRYYNNDSQAVTEDRITIR